MRAALLAIAASVAVSAAMNAPAATTTTSGLRGILLRGPISPVCRVDRPCDEPAAHSTLVFSRAGRTLARARTGADGRFRVALTAGRYAVRTTRTGLEREVAPDRVTVPSGRYARVTFRIDTGIR